MKKHIKNISLFVFALLCWNSTRTENTNPDKQDYITIWVHGTLPPAWPLLAHDIFFSIPGLHPASDYAEKYQLRKISNVLAQQDPKAGTMYCFGWSGWLSPDVREHAAQDLHHNIQQLVAQHRTQHGREPYIRIITHSHGGNIALQLARFSNNTSDYSVDELILLACPVQQTTCHYTKHALFKRIFHLYTGGDMIQVADPQGLYTLDFSSLFSKRTFDVEYPVTQVCIKTSGKMLFHASFISRWFIITLPQLLDTIEQEKSKQPHVSHFELNAQFSQKNLTGVRIKAK